MEVIERLDCGKMRVWDIYMGSDYIGVVKFNTESENFSFKVHPQSYSLVKVVVNAMDVVKSQIADEILLE